MARILLTGFPDRIAKVKNRSGRVKLSQGGEATLAGGKSHHRPGDLLLALEAGTRKNPSGRASTVIYRATPIAPPITPKDLIDVCADALDEQVEVVWDGGKKRVDAFSRLRMGAVVLEETRVDPTTLPETAEILAREALRLGISSLVDSEELSQLLTRVNLLVKAFPEQGLAPLTMDDLPALLKKLAEGKRSLKELKKADLLGEMKSLLPPWLAANLDRLAPTHIRLPGRKRAPISYPSDTRPYVASYMQDFFKLKATPSIADGRVSLLLHLLAPNKRAEQVTDDLAGFWERTYPALRTRLMRRYPKHWWPENPEKPGKPG